MKRKDSVWECECGSIAYGLYPPQECPQCQAIDSFIKVPEDEIEEKEAENVLSMKPAEDEDE